MVVDQLKGGQFLFAWHSNQRLLQASAYLQCKPQRVASILARQQRLPRS
jgi:hypothetical protein